MSDKVLQLRVGMGTLLISAAFLLYVIPNWVTTPANVPQIVLSPLLWPVAIAGLTSLTGLLLIFNSLWSNNWTKTLQLVNSLWSSKGAKTEDTEGISPVLRMALIGLIMIATVWCIPRLGMVMTCVIGYLTTALIMTSLLPKKLYLLVIVTAVLFPLALYYFFTSVVGIVFPQGLFLSLP